MSKEYISELNNRMSTAVASLKHTLNGLRTGRASVALLEPVRVNAYGSMSPITQVASVNVLDANMLSVNVWDSSLVNPVVKAILDSGLGLNPVAEGQIIRVPLPSLSEERRKELSKKAHEYGEAAKVAVRNIRRDGNDHFKKLEKDKQISEDECKRCFDEVQKLTDDFIKHVDSAVEAKIKDIMQV